MTKEQRQQVFAHVGARREALTSKPHRVIADILATRSAQRERWGDPKQSLPEWLCVITEEIGEAATEINDGFLGCKDEPGDWLGRTRTELVQAAALIVRMIESIDNGEHGGCNE